MASWGSRTPEAVGLHQRGAKVIRRNTRPACRPRAVSEGGNDYVTRQHGVTFQALEVLEADKGRAAEAAR